MKKRDEEKQLKIAIYVMAGLILIVFLGSYMINNSKGFSYAGLEFQKEKRGELELYLTSIPIIDPANTGEMNHFNFYFREDPRKLENIGIHDRINLGGNVAIASGKKDIESCEDSILAATTLSVFLKQIDINLFPATTNKTEAEESDRIYANCSDSKYVTVEILNGDENKIVKEENCYKLVAKDCEVMNVAERFMLGAYAHANGIEI